MKSNLLSLFVLLASLQSGVAAVTFSFEDTDGDPNSVTIQPGADFAVSLHYYSTAEQAYILEYRLAAMGSGSGQFTIVGRDVTGTPFDALATTNATVLQSANAILDPSNNDNLGGDTTTGLIPTGSYKIATYTIRSSASIPHGTYTLTTTNLMLFDENFMEVPGIPTASYSITVVPEPSSALIASATSLLVLRRRRSRK